MSFFDHGPGTVAMRDSTFKTNSVSVSKARKNEALC